MLFQDTFLVRKFWLWASVVVGLASTSAWAQNVTTMTLTTSPQTLPISSCSRPVTVTAITDSGQRNYVTSNTTLYFDQGDQSLKIFTDSACTNQVYTLTMSANTSSKTFNY